MREFASISPDTGELLKRFSPATAAESDAAILAGWLAYQASRALTLEERCNFAPALADQLRKQAADLSRLISTEMGKPLPEAAAEVEKSAWLCEVAPGNALRALPPTTVDTGFPQSFVEHLPLGILLGIMPWNFPVWQTLRFAMPAILAGNAVIVKPAPSVPQTALLLQLIVDAVLPAGTFQTLLLPESDVGGLIAHPHIAGVSLTGSTTAGRAVGVLAADSLTPCVLELGGSDPYVVLPDADIAHAVANCVKGRFANAGQSCIAAKRWIIHSSRFDEFVAAASSAVEQLVVGSPFDPSTTVGPLARPDLVDALVDQVAASAEYGDRILVGGSRLDGAGNFFAPTLVHVRDSKSPLVADEVFGPVAALLSYESEEDAIRIANDTQYGLGAAVFGEDVEHATEVARELEAGMVFLNSMVVSDPRVPFGGIKQSGYGRELGDDGPLAFVNSRAIVQRE